MARWGSRIAGVLRAGSRYVMSGLAHLGLSSGPVVYLGPMGLPQVAPRTTVRLAGPPPAHPERLVPHVPLTEVERALWTDLGWTAA
jgi:hypothetical protein